MTDLQFLVSERLKKEREANDVIFLVLVIGRVYIMHLCVLYHQVYS